MSRFVASFAALAAVAIALTGCSCDSPCDPCHAPRPKCNTKPAPKPCQKPAAVQSCDSCN